MSTPEELIAKYAARFREVYCRERNTWHLRCQGKTTHFGCEPVVAWDGGTTAVGVRHQPVWPKLGRLVVKEGLYLPWFVRCLFDLATHDPPSPSDFLKPRALLVYRDTLATRDQDLSKLLEYQKQRAYSEIMKLQPLKAKGWSDADILRAVLGNLLVSMSALFRFCLARQAGMDTVAAGFRDEAVEQYLVNVEGYNKVWGDFLPADLKAETADLRDSVNAPAPESNLSDLCQPYQREIVID